jgi:hypothetical protein
MASIPITVKVEESYFIQILRSLRGLSGVTDVHFDFSTLGSPKGATRKEPQIAKGDGNGPAGANELLIALLAQGPQHVKVIQKAMTGAGFKASGAGSFLNVLKKKGIVESGGVGIHKLTEQAMHDLARARPALPPPEPPMVAGKKRVGPGILEDTVIGLMQGRGGSAHRAELAKAIVAIGSTAKSLNTLLHRLQGNGLVKGLGEGIYELTAKGKHFKPTEKD